MGNSLTWGVSSLSLRPPAPRLHPAHFKSHARLPASLVVRASLRDVRVVVPRFAVCPQADLEVDDARSSVPGAHVLESVERGRSKGGTVKL